ncbi:hypothetical protein SKAU_G00387250 [Synaphobranchus kaupii]|uniref:CCHC-type domain-containing protein n=1 Tax=Synaphobranchus kaupii TaxID=118154 RepID=A0A9Q1IB94_SYNKA|nr:hypothetical protein SKAU_G00387250 [Synaphobranchus kaupii]
MRHLRRWDNTVPKAETMPRHYWHARMWSRRHAECMDPVLAVAHRRLYGVLRTKLGPVGPVGVARGIWARLQPKGLGNRLKDLTWLIVLNRLPVRDVLYRHGISLNQFCLRNMCFGVETVEHTFWSCAFAQDVWAEAGTYFVPLQGLTAKGVLLGEGWGKMGYRDWERVLLVLSLFKKGLWDARSASIRAKVDVGAKGIVGWVRAELGWRFRVEEEKWGEEAGEEKAGEEPLSFFSLSSLERKGLKVVTIHIYNPYVGDETLRSFLSRYGEVQPGGRHLKDGYGIWTGKRPFRVLLKEDPQGFDGLLNPPAFFSLGADRGFLFYSGQPMFCRLCRVFGHMAGDCKEEARCRNCKEVGHATAACPTPKKCHACGSVGHLFRECPKRSKTYADAAAGRRGPAVQGPVSGLAEEGKGPESVEADTEAVLVQEACVPGAAGRSASRTDYMEGKGKEPPKGSQASKRHGSKAKAEENSSEGDERIRCCQRG